MDKQSTPNQYQWDANLYQSSHNFVYEYGKDVITLLDPKPNECILDIGCGTGQLTAEISKFGAQVTGIDASESMIAEAKKNYPAIDFRIADARTFNLGIQFDAVFSNAAFHWIKPPEDVVKCISAALKLGGRMAVEFGGKYNIHQAHTALENAINELDKPNVRGRQDKYFPSIGEYTPLLEANGLEVRKAFLFDRLTPLEGGEGGLRNWYKQFTDDLLKPLSEVEKEQVLHTAETVLRPVLYQNNQWHMDYRRIRILAVKE